MKPIQSNLHLLFCRHEKLRAHLEWKGYGNRIFIHKQWLYPFMDMGLLLFIETSCLILFIFDLIKLEESFNVLVHMHNAQWDLFYCSWEFMDFSHYFLALLRTEIPLGKENTMVACLLQQKVLLFNEMMHYNLRR